MSKLSRITGKVFGASATASGDDPEIGQFGSALAGTYNGTTDYTGPMLIFAAFGIIAILIAVMLLVEDKKKNYGLQQANVTNQDN